jgi:hypothetical protein
MENCPSCGHVGAYIGFSSIECLNMDCEHFSIKLFAEFQRLCAEEKMLQDQAAAEQASVSGELDIPQDQAGDLGVCPPPDGSWNPYASPTQNNPSACPPTACDVNNCNIDEYKDASRGYSEAAGGLL